jgi:hypothetical protein
MSNIEPQKNRGNFADKVIKKFFLIAVLLMIGIGLKGSLFPNFRIENLIPKKESVEPEKATQEEKTERTKASNQEKKQEFERVRVMNSPFVRKNIAAELASSQSKKDSLAPSKKTVAPVTTTKPKVVPNNDQKKEVKPQKQAEPKSKIYIEKHITPNDTLIIRTEIMPDGTVKTKYIEHKKIKADTLNWDKIRT